MQTFTMRDFSGGLNTAIDQSALRPEFSPDMSNVELLESRAIRRRKGYAPMTATAVRTGSRIEGLGLVQLAQSQYWISRCGTAFFGVVDVDGGDTYGYVQAENMVTGTGYTTATFNGLSGGTAIRLSRARYGATGATFSVPKNTRIKVYYRGRGTAQLGTATAVTLNYANPDLTASQLTTATYEFTNVTATARTLKIAASVTQTDTKYLRFNKDVAGGAVNAVGAVLDVWSVGGGQREGILSEGRRFSFYCKPNNPYPFEIGFRASGASSGTYDVAIGVFVGSTGKAVVNTSGGATITTGVTSAVWTRFDFKVDAGFLWVSSGSSGWLNCGAVASSDDKFAVNLNPTSTPNPLNFRVLIDEFTVDGIPARHGDNWSSEWAGVGCTITDQTDGAANGTRDIQVDVIEYQASSVQTRKAALSASSSDLAYAVLNGKVYFGTPHNAIRSWNGATVATITASGTAPPARFLVSHKRRLFAAGKASDPSILEYTDVDSGENWSDGGAIRVTGKDAGGDCTGLAVWNDVLWYFGYSRLHALDITGPDSNWVNKTISERYGCIAPRTLALSPNAMLFLSEGGVRGYGVIPGTNDADGSGFLLVSEAIKPDLDRINSAYLHRACATFWKDRYYISVPLDDATENNVTYVYRMGAGRKPGAWTKYDYGVTAFHAPRGDDGNLYAGTSNGYVMRLEYGSTDNGDPIQFYYKTPPLPIGGYSTIKHFRRLHLGAESSAPQSVTVEPYTDDESGSAVSLALSTSTDIRPVRTPFNARGRSLGLTLSGQGNDQDVTISEVTLVYVEPKMR